MAKYSKKAEDKIGDVMHEYKRGELKSGRSGKKVKNRKQAIAIAISEARESGAKVPKKKSATATRKKAAKKNTTRKKSTGRTKSKSTGRKSRY